MRSSSMQAPAGLWNQFTRFARFCPAVKSAIDFLSVALLIGLAGAASAATASFTTTGLPPAAEYEKLYNITVKFTYTWGNTNDRPVSGAFLILYESDASFNDSDLYSQVALPPPTNAVNPSGTWTNTITFTNILLVELGGFDDTNDTLQVRSRLTVHSSLGDTNLDSTFVNTPVKPGLPGAITLPATSSDGRYTVSWGEAKGARQYELQQSTNKTSWLTLTNTTNLFWITPTPRPNRSTNYYQVRAKNKTNVAGDWRTNLTGVIVRYPNQLPTSPGTISVTNITATAATLNWVASTDPDKDPITYEVQFAPTSAPQPWISAGTTTNVTLRLTGLAADTKYNVRVIASDGEGGSSLRELTEAFQTAHLFAPSLSTIPAQTTVRNQPSAPIPYTISDVDSPTNALFSVTVSTSNPLLAPVENILIGSGTNRSVKVPAGSTFVTNTVSDRLLRIVPVTNSIGSAFVTVTVTDEDKLTASTTFKFTVISPPTLSPVAEQRTPTGQTISVNFTVSDNETPTSGIVVNATSGNTVLVANGNIEVQGGGGSRQIVLTPTAGRTGTAQITVTATDTDGDQASVSFTLVVFEPVPAIELAFSTQTLPRDSVPTNLAFTVTHPIVAANLLTVTPTSSNTNLVRTENLLVTGTSSNKTVRVVLEPNQSGSSTITLTVRDPAGVTATTNFVVRTSDVAPPTVSLIPGQSTLRNTPTQAVSFTVEDGQSPADSLQFFKSSSNHNLVPDENIFLFGTGTQRQIVVRPLPDRIGVTTITLVVLDTDRNTTSASFTVEVKDPPSPATVSILLAFGDQTVRLNHPTPALPFIISPRADFTVNIRVAATSSNPAYVPDANIALDGSGTNWTVTVTPVTNKIDAATISLTATDSGGVSGRASFQVRTINPVPPVISTISDQITVRNKSTPFIPFTVSDAETPPDRLIVTAVSTNKTLVPDSNIFFSGSGTNRNIFVTPITNQVGVTTIIISVRDEDQKTATASFKVTVLSPPIVSPVPNQVMARNHTNVVSFTLSDPETPAANLIVTANSSNGFLFPDPSLQLVGTGGSRQLVLVPTRDQFGDSVITITVRDADNNSERISFVQTVLRDEPAIKLGFADQTIRKNTSSGPLPFTVSHPSMFGGFLTVEGHSSNLNFVPDANIVFAGNSENRTVTVTPAPDQVGVATITLTVKDPVGLTATTRFVVRTPDATPPTITSIPNQKTPRNTPTTALTFVINDTETPVADLRLTGSSSNKELVPDENILFTGTESARQTLITPNPDRSGQTTITLTVTDSDNNRTSTSFVLTVLEQPPVVQLGFGDQAVPRKSSTGPLPFKVVLRPGFAGTVRVEGSSSNKGFIPDSNIAFGGSGANRTVTVSPDPAQIGVATITISAIDSDGLVGSASFLVRTADSEPPTISAIPNQTTVVNTITPVIPFVIGDRESAPEELKLSATSAAVSLVPEANILFSGSGATRTLIITPAADQIGSVTITVTVADPEGKTASRAFLLTIIDNAPPSISRVADVTISKNETTAPIVITVSDKETPAERLEVRGVSSNKRLVPDENISITRNGANRTLVITPAPNQIGTALITLTVRDDAQKTANAAFVLTVKPAPPFKGDLDGDFQPDLVFQDSEGFLAVWFLDGARLKAASFLTPSNVGDADWKIVGRGDFNRDGHEDLLFQHRDGALGVWLMNSAQQLSVAPLSPGTTGDANWRVAATGDFDGDGWIDLVFQHKDGTLALWYMNGLNLASARLIEPSQSGPDWRVVGAGDFGIDGKTDLAFQHADGTLAVWLMDGHKLIQAGLMNPSTPGNPNWRVAGVADYNQDGQPDLLFQKADDGALAVWFMNGINVSEGVLVNPSVPGGTWKVAPP